MSEVQSDCGSMAVDILAKGVVSGVKRRICIRIVRFCRSMCEVQILAGFWFPPLTTGTASTVSAGEERCFLSAAENRI
jgi:hypothetical protein